MLCPLEGLDVLPQGVDVVRSSASAPRHLHDRARVNPAVRLIQHDNLETWRISQRGEWYNREFGANPIALWFPRPVVVPSETEPQPIAIRVHQNLTLG